MRAQDPPIDPKRRVGSHLKPVDPGRLKRTRDVKKATGTAASRPASAPAWRPPNAKPSTDARPAISESPIARSRSTEATTIVAGALGSPGRVGRANTDAIRKASPPSRREAESPRLGLQATHAKPETASGQCQRSPKGHAILRTMPGNRWRRWRGERPKARAGCPRARSPTRARTAGERIRQRGRAPPPFAGEACIQRRRVRLRPEWKPEPQDPNSGRGPE
jgi:hypothetical protein